MIFLFLDEEVLVDDFDGQCCRTYPDNHSKIIKWRAQRIDKIAKQVKNMNYSKYSWKIGKTLKILVCMYFVFKIVLTFCEKKMF